ncbi:alpha/beta hydrolase [Paenibacillus sp. An7]|uniref:alpha/beta hydrolase n=1 Tax=Paenibacillus sp. An7 TaxID=2689577 RepID=UPI00135C8E89|nr:alpha/beta hydrolase [Paenibacillus sp. An7]
MNKKKILHFGVLATILTTTACSPQSAAQEDTQTQSATATNYGAMTDVSIRVEPIELTEEWDKVFPLSDEVNHRKVTFVNHFGITIAADLYEPKNYEGKLPAIAVSGPFGAVKEQSSGLYAQEMAKKGFLAIAFDPSYTGESSGYPRYFNSPDVNVEDFQSAIDFLSVQENVDPDQIGIIGICGFGGHALQTAALDTRIKATAIMTMYDMSRVTALGYNDSLDEEGRYQARVDYNNQRTEDYTKGSYTLGGGNPEKAPDDAPQFIKDYVDYYKTERGYHTRSVNSNGGWASTAAGSLMNMRILEYAPEIRSDVLVVHGGDAHSLYFSQDAFKLLKGDNKELDIIPGASHTDLYDQIDVIPFDKLETFFTDAFADES